MTVIMGLNQKELELNYYADKRKARLDKLAISDSKGNSNRTKYGKSIMGEIINEVLNHYEECLNKEVNLTKSDFWNLHFLPAIKVHGSDIREINHICYSSAYLVAEELTSAIIASSYNTATINKIIRKHISLLNLTKRDKEDLGTSTEIFFNLIGTRLENLGYYNIVQENGRKLFIKPTPEMEKDIQELKEFHVMVSSAKPPMVVPPLPHTSLYDKEGGYYINVSPILKSPTCMKEEKEMVLKKNGEPKIKRGIPIYKKVKTFHPFITDFTPENNPFWFEQNQRLQETAMVVNLSFANEVLRLRDRGLQLEGFEFSIENLDDLIDSLVDKRRNKREKYRKAYCETNPDAEYKDVSEGTLHRWKKELEGAYTEQFNKMNALMEQVNEFKDYDELYFPAFCDSRGRRYLYATNGLNPLGDSITKSMLKFAKADRLNSTGLRALYHSLGNTLELRASKVGVDKFCLPIKARLAKKFFKEYKDSFLKGDYSIFVHNDNKEFFIDDAPTSMAVCVELINHITNPDYKSGFMCHRDARCSGISIMGATLGDLKAMELTSVVDKNVDGRLLDAYQAAAEQALALCAMDSIDGNPFAKLLLCFKDELFNRKCFKFPVMVTLGYAGSDSGLRKHASESILDVEELLDDVNPELITYFKDLIKRSLYELLPSCVNLITTNKEVAHTVGREHDMIAVKMPITGFPLIVKKNKEKEATIQVGFYSKVINPVIKKITEEPNYDKMVSSFPPCIVHGIDATLLSLVQSYVDFDICTVHDSIASTPNNVDKLVRAYAKAVHTVATMDFWKELYQGLGLETTAPRVDSASTEDYSSILESKHILV